MKANEAAPGSGRASGPGQVGPGYLDRVQRSFEGLQVSLSTRDLLLSGLALVVLTLLLRPYVGIEHDAHLYAIQAIRQVGGTELDRDLFFRFGNQSDFLAFGLIYTPVVSWLGISMAHVVFFGLGMVFWLGSVTWVTATVFANRGMAVLAMGAVIILSPSYGNIIFGYGENFVTPRIFAESFSLLAIASLLRRRYLLTLVFAALAFAMHPLLAAPAIVLLAWIWLRSWKIFLALAVATTLLVLGLGAAGVGAFSWIFTPIDADWFKMIVRHDPIVFPLHWSKATILATVPIPLAVLICLARSDQDLPRQIAVAVLAVAALLVAVSLVGTSLYPNKLITALQPWRALWLMTFIGNLLAPLAVLLALRAGSAGGYLVLALLLMVAERAIGFVTIGSSVVALAYLVPALVPGLAGALPDRVLRLARALVVLVGILVTLTSVPIFIGTYNWGGLAHPVLKGLFIVALWSGLSGIARGDVTDLKKLVFWITAAGFYAVVFFDARSPIRRYAETQAPVDATFEAMLPGKTVYWEDQLIVLWFRLQVPSYYSCRQKGGMVFFREQAFEFQRRGNGLRGLNTVDFATNPDSQCHVKADLEAEGPETTDQLIQACKALPDLDLMVLENRVEDAAVHSFSITPPGSASQALTYHVYDCATLRQR